MKKIIYFLLIVIWMLIVFMFSNENGEKSSNTSSQVTEIIVDIFIPKKDTIITKRTEIISKVEPVIRKLAHFTIYLIGGFLIINYINTYSNINLKRKIIIAIAIGILYAITDEIHQYYVAQRAGRITDVIIDSCGVCTGIYFFKLLMEKYFRKSKEKN